MSVLRRNIFANFGGQAASTVIAFVTVPLYIRFLGTDGYGLVSFLLTLQALAGVLDLGLSATANREVSRYLAHDRAPADRHTLVRTLEVYYYGTGLVLFLAIAAAVPWLATDWLRSSPFGVGTLRTCFLLAAASIALRWPTALYHGILRGTEQQVALNLVTSLAAALRGFGTILVLLLIDRDVVVFYWWQLIFSVVELAACVVVVARGTAGFHGRGGRFDLEVLRGLWRFSIRVGGLSLFALVLKQLDRVVMARLLPISHVGFYSAAQLASTGITKVGQPVQSAVFPRLTSLHASEEPSALAATFHRSCQLTAFLTVPCACVLLFFPHEVLLLWTRNAELAAHGSRALAILAAAMMLNGMMSVPFSLQLAVGLTWLPLAQNAIGAVVIAPLIVYLVRTQGIAGGAMAWFVFNALYFLLVPPVMFRHVLRAGGHYVTWLTRDTLPFMAAGVAAFALARWVAAGGSLLAQAGAAAAALVAYGAIMLGVNDTLRQALVRFPRSAHPQARTP